MVRKGGETEEVKEVRTDDGENVEREVNEKNTFDTTPTSLGAAGAERGTEVQVFESATKRKCFTRDRSLKVLEDEYSLETGSILAAKEILFLPDPRYSTRSARSQCKHAHGVFTKLV